jgi:hypothetical protein
VAGCCEHCNEPSGSIRGGVKLKLFLCLTKYRVMKTYCGSGDTATRTTSALDGGEWSASSPGRFSPRERATGTHWIGGWVGPRAVLDAVVKRKIPSPCRDSNPPIIQPVAQRYTIELSQLWAVISYFLRLLLLR